jgi:hypothetical protein
MRVDGSWQGTKAAVVATHATKIATVLVSCISAGKFFFQITFQRTKLIERPEMPEVRGEEWKHEGKGGRL